MNANASPNSAAPAFATQRDYRQIVGIAIVFLIAIVAVAVNTYAPVDRDRPLFDKYQVTDHERQRIILAWGAAGLTEYRLKNGQLYVPQNEHANYLSAITDNDALPAIFSAPKELKFNPLMPRSQQALMEQDRKKQKVRDMILRLPFVAEAWFEMDRATSDTLFAPDHQSAVVMVRPERSSVLSRQNVATIQGLVSGTIAGIQSQQVVVIDAGIGTSYRDMRDTEQSQLIELVNWKMNRKEFYRQRIMDSLREYSGLEFEIQVENVDESVDILREDQIAKRPDKVAQHRTTTRRQPLPQIGLNCSASVTAPHPPTHDPLVIESQSPVIHTSYQQTLPPTVQATTRPATDHPQFREAIRVKVRVPAILLDQLKPEGWDDTFTVERKFEILRDEIVARIQNAVPAKVLASALPISVVLIQTEEMLAQPPMTSIYLHWLQIYWPIAAAIIVGLIFVFWARSQQPMPRPRVASPVAATESEEDQLQHQLSNLIDNDPATAAKVIKSWIRQS